MNENGERFSIFESAGFLRCNCPGLTGSPVPWAKGTVCRVYIPRIPGIERLRLTEPADPRSSRTGGRDVRIKSNVLRREALLGSSGTDSRLVALSIIEFLIYSLR